MNTYCIHWTDKAGDMRQSTVEAEAAAEAIARIAGLSNRDPSHGVFVFMAWDMFGATLTKDEAGNYTAQPQPSTAPTLTEYDR